MLKAYDLAVKKLIKVFSGKIDVFGLQNDDSSATAEPVLTQLGKDSKDDKLSFPVISVFRSPEILIIDGSKTKRANTSEGYAWVNGKGVPVQLVVMRSDLKYTVDVFDVTRASAEEIATKLYFRLRNNPQVEATFKFKELDKAETCISEIELDEQITNMRVNDKTQAQVYKIRFTFTLKNVNLYDVLTKEMPDLKYNITVELAE